MATTATIILNATGGATFSFASSFTVNLVIQGVTSPLGVNITVMVEGGVGGTIATGTGSIIIPANDVFPGYMCTIKFDPVYITSASGNASLMFNDTPSTITPTSTLLLVGEPPIRL